MKIVENTDSRLVLADRPWLLGGMTWAMGLAALWAATTDSGIDGPAQHALLAAVGLGLCGAAWWCFPVVRVVFDRERGVVAHDARRLFRTTRKEMPLSRVERAATEAERRESSRLTRLILITAHGPAPLEIGFSGADRSAAETAVNEWLRRAGVAAGQDRR